VEEEKKGKGKEGEEGGGKGREGGGKEGERKEYLTDPFPNMVTEGDFFFLQVCRVPGRDIAGSKVLGGFTVQPLTVAPAQKRKNLGLGLELGLELGLRLGFTCSRSLWLHSQGTPGNFASSNCCFYCLKGAVPIKFQNTAT